MIELIFTVFAYFYVAGYTMLLALGFTVSICLLVHRTIRIGIRAFAKYYVPCLFLVCAVSLWLCFNPIITCDAAAQERLTPEMIQSHARLGSGFYSPRIPLFPYWVEIETICPEHIAYEQITVHYAYAGTSVYSYQTDCYNCEKYLFAFS